MSRKNGREEVSETNRLQNPSRGSCTDPMRTKSATYSKHLIGTPPDMRQKEEEQRGVAQSRTTSQRRPRSQTRSRRVEMFAEGQGADSDKVLSDVCARAVCDHPGSSEACAKCGTAREVGAACTARLRTAGQLDVKPVLLG